MKHSDSNYNLLIESWIPVLWSDGNYSRVGIKEALTQAHRIRQIAASNPMDRMAILRFLLAMLYWCKGNPPGCASGRDSFPAGWFQKLDDSRESFNLFGDGKRFYQCPPPWGKGTPKKLTANYLIHEVPSGTNKWHFWHSTDEVDGLCPACCAMGLLRLPLFATSGGRGKPPGINAKPPLYVMPIGVSLAETLGLSWREASNLGKPFWECLVKHLPESGKIPLLMGLTWLPRQVWLDDPEEPEASCIACGSRELLIRRCVFAGIGSTKTAEGSAGRIWRDPHVIYEENSKGEVLALHASDALGASDAAAGQWARIMVGILSNQSSLIPSLQKKNAGISVWVVGFSTVQNDKYLEANEVVIPLDSVPQPTEGPIEKVKQWQKECLNLARRAQPSDKRKPSTRKHIEIPPAIAAIRPHVEARVSSRAGLLYHGTEVEWQRAANEYRPMMEALAESVSPGVTTKAVQRRRRIAGAMPWMRVDPPPARKAGQDKRSGY